MPRSGGIYNNDRETIRSDHAIVNGDYCQIYGSHCVINGDCCIVYGSHNVINGDYCQVKRGSHNILNGQGCTDQGEMNFQTNSTSQYNSRSNSRSNSSSMSNIIINNDLVSGTIDFNNLIDSNGSSTIRIGRGIGSVTGNITNHWGGDGSFTITTSNSSGGPTITTFSSGSSSSSSSRPRRRNQRTSSPTPRNSTYKNQADEEPFTLLSLEGEAEATEVEREQCVICMVHKKNILFQPCKHVCCCVNCARQLGDSQPSKCPECRVVVTYAEKIFF